MGQDTPMQISIIQKAKQDMGAMEFCCWEPLQPAQSWSLFSPGLGKQSKIREAVCVCWGGGSGLEDWSGSGWCLARWDQGKAGSEDRDVATEKIFKFKPDSEISLTKITDLEYHSGTLLCDCFILEGASTVLLTPCLFKGLSQPELLPALGPLALLWPPAHVQPLSHIVSA